MDESEFREILDRAGRHDTEAERLLVERFGPVVEREIRLSTIGLPNNVGRSDIYQSVMGRLFLGVYAGRYELDRPEELVRLLKRMTRNRLIDHHRHKKIERVVAAENSEQAPYDPVDEQTSPSEDLRFGEIKDDFERRIGDDVRAIFELRRRDLGWDAIAESLGKGGAEAIRKRYERAVDRVLKSMGLKN
jgi:DNA-directed RNA polymerase specialized sigma24 family protein